MRKTLKRYKLWILSGVLAASASTSGQSLPRSEGRTLTDRSMVIADAVSGKPSLFIVTFSKGAGEKAAVWVKALQEKGVLNSKVAFYQIAELEDVPRFFRGMAISGMRKGVPKEQHDNFVILTADTDAWKKFVSFEKDDFPYLLLLNAKSNITLRIYGEKTDERLKQLAEKMR